MISTVYDSVFEFLFAHGLSLAASLRLAFAATLLSVCLLSWIVGLVLHYVIAPPIGAFVKRTKVHWDDYILSPTMLRAMCNIVPGVIFYHLFPLCFATAGRATTSTLYVFFDRGTSVFITLTVMWLLTTFVKNLGRVAEELMQKHHLLGILQFARIIIYSLCGITAIALAFGRNPLTVLVSLGAAATVLMLVFKDSILGLVAGIQLSANRMLKVGDWVTIEKLGIDGTVEEISLTTVKVRNFDKSVSTVPPYTLVSDCFKNWDTMQNLGSRRFKKTLYIDANTVRLLTKQELADKKFAAYLTSDERKGGNMVNLTLFRHYVEQTLHNRKDVNTNDWILTRISNLESGRGVPVEIWLYVRETDFEKFEELSAQAMEQFMAALPLFGLRQFQLPTGYLPTK